MLFRSESDELFEALRDVRRTIAQKHRIPAYAVFNDATLHAMASKKPCTKEEMLRVQGIGEIKLRKYGQAFLRVIQKHRRTEAAGADADVDPDL